MAKKSTSFFRLVSSIGTGFHYFVEKNKLSLGKKMVLRKYDPMVNQYVLFNEQKLASGRKRT